MPVVRHLQPGHLAERAQRVFKLDAVALDHKVDRVPTLLAPVAVEVLLAGTDVERRRFLLVERTQADEIFSPALKRDASADQFNDVRRLENAGLKSAPTFVDDDPLTSTIPVYMCGDDLEAVTRMPRPRRFQRRKSKLSPAGRVGRLFQK
jgi:hypothetical protein